MKVLKKLIKDSSKYALLDSIGKTSSLMKNAHAETLKFIQTVLYSGKEEETLVQTRILLYQAMKTKSSQSSPPDPDSARQAIVRIHYQVYYWLRYAVKMVPAISFADNGWKLDENRVSPVWFTGTYTQICSLFRPFWSLCPKSHCKRMFLFIFHLRQPVSAFPDKKDNQNRRRKPSISTDVDANKDDSKGWQPVIENDGEASISMSEMDHILFGDVSSSDTDSDMDDIDRIP